MKNQTTSIGLLGFGTVGQAVYELLQTSRDFLRQKMCTDIVVKRICVRDLKKNRGGVDKKLFTTNYHDVISDPDISLVVELMGDCPEALAAIKLALSRGNSVVTANKAIMARHALELFDLARAHHCEILFEAAVAGAIPVMRTLREGLAANRIHLLRGIINGTSNYILSKMTHEKAEFNDVLRQAQKLGYAEADPSADVDGHDAAYKLCLLAMLCHGRVVNVDDIFCKGIHFIKPLDIEMASQFGYHIKLLGITKIQGEEFEARVHPAMISKENPLAHVNGPFNAIQYHTDFAGEGMLYGCGAGGRPTASAVVGDIIEIGRSIESKNKINLEPSGFLPDHLKVAKPKDVLDLHTRYYIRFSVLDRTNVLAHITSVLGKHNISIQHLYQHGEQEDKAISIIVFTHVACERDVRAALKVIDAQDYVTQVTKIIRIEDDV